jgi:hypothetical protein
MNSDTNKAVPEPEDVGVQPAPTDNRRAERYAWIGWFVLFLIVDGMIVSGNTRTFVRSYWIAASDWLAGRNLYDGFGVGGFVYLPQAAILFVPFSLFPPVLCEILWRIVNIGTFAAGLRSFSRIAGERSGKDLFPLMTLVAIPFAWDCARNGQATLAMAGLMLLTVTDMARSRWWRATLWVCLSVAVKPLSIVLLLLVASTERRMAWRVMVWTGVVALAPFLAQHTDYVLRQYAAFLQNTMTAAHVGVVSQGWSTPFTALRVAGLPVPEQVQTVIRIAAAFVTLLLCFVVKRRNDADNSSVFLFSLASTYIILFSPRTETVTYALIGPAVGVFLARAYVIEKQRGESLLLTGIAIASIASMPLQRLIAPHAEQIWLPPLMGTIFAGYLLFRLLTDPATNPHRQAGQNELKPNI